MPLAFLAPPRVSRAGFCAILSAAASPAAGEGGACYDAFLSYGLDPAIALAFFRHESTYGTAGVARRTRNWGNLRKGQGHEAHTLAGWAWYRRWVDGARDWAALIARAYVPRGWDTVEAAIPHYAPASDNNAPARYIAAVRADVARWAARSPADGPTAARQMAVREAGTRVRATPSLAGQILRTLAAGQVVAVAAEAQGGAVPRLGGATTWARITAPVDGYVALGLLREI